LGRLTVNQGRRPDVCGAFATITPSDLFASLGRVTTLPCASRPTTAGWRPDLPQASRRIGAYVMVGKSMVLTT